MLKGLHKTKSLVILGICLVFLLSTCVSASTAAVPPTAVDTDVTKKLMAPPTIQLNLDDSIKNIKVVDHMKDLVANIVVTKLQADVSKNAKTRTTGNILVLVNRDLYPDIKGNISTYTSDLASEGYASKVYTVSGKDPVQLKTFIRNYWISIFTEYVNGRMDENTFRYGTGVFLVGDLPIPLVHSRVGEYTDENGVKKPYEGVFVCDLYFTDMDGNWEFTDDEGIPFISTVDPSIINKDSECTSSDFVVSPWQAHTMLGDGGAKPEIWMGRLAAGPVATVNGNYSRDLEVKLTKEYFERNHAYRHGQYPYVPRGENGLKYAARDRLVYYDDPWSGVAQRVAESYKLAWGGSLVQDYNTGTTPYNRYVSTESYTSASDYKSWLTKRFLWVELLAHSNPWGHGFYKWDYNYDSKEYEWKETSSIGTYDIANTPAKGLFYNMEGCDTCDYRQTRNLGETYLFHGKSLAVIGNTTVGPQECGTLYKYLGYGANLGMAFMINQKMIGKPGWYTNMVSENKIDPKRHYGQTLLGDPTLKPIVFVPKTAPYTIGHGPVTYAKLSPILGSLTKQTDAKALGKAVIQRNQSETRNKLKKIPVMPEKGFDYLKLDPTQIVRDPQYDKFIKLPKLDIPQFEIKPTPIPATTPTPTPAPLVIIPKGEIPVLPLITPTPSPTLAPIEAQKFIYSVTLSAKDPSILLGKKATLSGTLTMSTQPTSAKPLAEKTVSIYEVVRINGMIARPTLVTTGTTDSSGNYLVEITPTEGTHYYVAKYVNSSNEVLAASSEVSVKVTKLSIIVPTKP